jgi:hypothetical protein
MSRHGQGRVNPSDLATVRLSIEVSKAPPNTRLQQMHVRTARHDDVERTGLELGQSLGQSTHQSMHVTPSMARALFGDWNASIAPSSIPQPGQITVVAVVTCSLLCLARIVPIPKYRIV